MTETCDFEVLWAGLTKWQVEGSEKGEDDDEDEEDEKDDEGEEDGKDEGSKRMQVVMTGKEEVSGWLIGWWMDWVVVEWDCDGREVLEGSKNGWVYGRDGWMEGWGGGLAEEWRSKVEMWLMALFLRLFLYWFKS